MGDPPATRKGNQCLVHSVASALATEPALEAVTIDDARRSIVVATLGQRRDPALEQRIAGVVRDADTHHASRACGLLRGESDCTSCDIPFAPFERQTISIKRGADATTTIARVTCPTSPRFWHWRRIPWPVLAPRQVESLPDEAHAGEWKWQLACAALCGVSGLLGHFSPVQFQPYLFGISYLAGAWFAAQEVWELLRERKLDVHFLMLAVAAGSAAIGAWEEGAVLLFLFSLSGALEHFAMSRTRREIESLFKNTPRSALVLDETGAERNVPVDQLETGMRLLLKPDSQVAVDAEILRGTTAADESNLTGESAPVSKQVGDTLLAGTLNLWGAVEAVVLRPAAESALQKIIRLIRDAQHLKAPAQRLTDRFGTPYTYAILAASVVMFLVWFALGAPAWTARGETPSAFYRAMTLLVVASPCALVLSIPSAVLAAIAWGARRGILFRGGAAVEQLAEVHVVALDKTGTLTTGELRVERVESFPPGNEEQVMQLAYSLDRFSNHPVARAITRHGKRQGLQPLAADKLESQPGLGVHATVAGRMVRVGRREWVLAHSTRPSPNLAAGTDPGLTEVWVAHDSGLGRLILRDDIRPEARRVLDQLRATGLHPLVLTGDRQVAAQHLKERLGLEDVRAELKPEDKVRVIEDFRRAGKKVAMVGDGVNDAPSLAAAHVGVAMGARGSEAALEQSSVILMHDRIENFWQAYQLSQRARRIIRQNLAISLGTVVILFGLALAGAIPLTIGVLGHEGSTVVVVMNSLRLLMSPRTGITEETG